MISLEIYWISVNMTVKSLSGTNLRAFIGAKDFEISKRFYLGIGFRLNWEREGLAELEVSDSKFFLQNYYDKQWCDNSMMHLTVTSANDWYMQISELLRPQAYGLSRCRPPIHEDYGALVTHVWDPSGVLWHFAEYDQ